jgi:hypothetical protein
MKKYKILENRPELSQSEIEKGMNFSKVTAKAGIEPALSFTKVWIAGAIGIAAVVTIAILMLSKTKEDQPLVVNETPAQIKNNENPLKQFSVDPGKDTILIFETGSMIKIPAGAFVDSSGMPVTGKVDIDYREFHNAGEIILAAIPMRYDSAGKEAHFESAGMFQINGTQNGEPIFISKGKAIEVAMVSLNSDSTKFNQYYLANNKWVYTGKDKPDFIKISDPVKADSVQKMPSKNFFQKIVKPIKKNKNRQQFMIEVNPESYPELAVFSKVIFEVSPKMKDFDPAKANQSWHDADIQRTGKSGEYKIIFKGTLNGKPEEYEVLGYPVVDEADYATAIKKYNDLSEAYQEKLNKKEKNETVKEAKLQSQLDRYVDAMNRYKQLVKENYQLMQQAAQTQQLVYRTFQVQNFGMYNSDCPRLMPQGMILAADFQNEQGKAMDVSTIYLVQKGVNAVYTYYPGKPIGYNPGENNVMVVITKDNTIGWVTRETLDQVDKSIKKHTFKMNTVRKSSYNLSDINNLLI